MKINFSKALRWKILAIALIAIFAVSTGILAYRVSNTPSSTVSAQTPDFLNVQISGAKTLGVGEIGTYVASVNNSASNNLSYSWSVTPSGNYTVLASDGSTCNLTFVSATTEPCMLSISVKDNVIGNLGYASIQVYDPYTEPNINVNNVADYSYMIETDGLGWYQAINGTDSSICWTSTNCATVFTDAVASGETIVFQTGTYDLSSSLTATGINNVDLHFDKGATLFVSNGMNTPAIYLISCNSWLIQNPTINGNAVNQQDDSGSGGTYTALYEDGIDIGVGSSNNHVDGANITNCGQVGFHVLDNTLGTSINNGITNSLITFCGWNGVGFGIDSGRSYATNVQVAYCGDVGISTYGMSSVITNNYVHDMNGTQGYNDAHGGIWVEGGEANTITGNNITTCLVGMNVQGGTFNTMSGNHITECESGIWLDTNNNLFSGNIITQWDPANTYNYAMAIAGNNNLITGNVLSSTNPYCFGIGITGNNNQVNGNPINCTLSTILDTGTGTIISNEPTMNPANLGNGSVLVADSISTITLTGGVSASAGQILYETSAGTYSLANAATSSTVTSALVIAVYNASAGASCQVMSQGYIGNSGWSLSTDGSNVYLAAVAGGITQTALTGINNVNLVIGSVVVPHIMYFNGNGHKNTPVTVVIPLTMDTGVISSSSYVTNYAKFIFNSTQFPNIISVQFQAIISGSSSGSNTGYVELWDFTGSAMIAGSQLTATVNQYVDSIQCSGNIWGAMTAGAIIYGEYSKATTQTVDITSIELIVTYVP